MDTGLWGETEWEWIMRLELTCVHCYVYTDN